MRANTDPTVVTRWLVTTAVVLLASTLGLCWLAAQSYAYADRHSEVSLHAATAQRYLQGYLRGVNELLITEGSSSARDLVKSNGEAFARELDSLLIYASADSATAIKKVLQPGWIQISRGVAALLEQSGISATDDDSMLAYGKVAGQAEALTTAVTGIETLAIPAADAARERLLFVGLTLTVVTLLFVVTIARLVAQLLFNRLGGRPDQIREIAIKLAAHDLTVEIGEPRAGRQATLLDALRGIKQNLGQVVGNVYDNANTLAGAAAQIAHGNQDLSQRTEQQAASIEKTVVSMQQLGATVRLNADHAQQASELATSATSVARQGGEVVGRVVDTMKGINESSRRIADITGVIDDIAFQTNILALNAAVEAARAGEQGRGFAVVATDVRSLARRSADAAKEIKTLISASVDRVEHGSSLVDRAGATMAQVVDAIGRLSDIVGQISAASARQSSEVSQVGDAMGLMDDATRQNAALVEHSALATESLRAQAHQLVQTVAVFKLDAAAAH